MNQEKRRERGENFEPNLQGNYESDILDEDIFNITIKEFIEEESLPLQTKKGKPGIDILLENGYSTLGDLCDVDKSTLNGTLGMKLKHILDLAKKANKKYGITLFESKYFLHKNIFHR